MNRYARIYRWLLKSYPTTFRAGYEEEMTQLLDDQLRDAYGSGRVMEPLRVFLRAAVDVAWTAPREHAEKEVMMARPAEGPVQSTPVPASRRLAVLVAAIPIAFWVVMGVTAPGYLDPLYSNPPGIIGLPAGLLVAIAAMLWALVGLVVAWRYGARSRTILAILAFFVVPIVVTMVLLPPVIVAIQNIAV